MTQQQRKAAHRMTWPLVALVALICAFFLGIFVMIPKDMPEGRTAMLGFLITSCTSVLAVVVQRLASKVEEVREQTNGAMSTLLAAKTQPDTETRG